MSGDVYVARRPGCQHIVAAFPAQIDKAIKGKLLEQLTKAGYDVDLTSETDVQINFQLHCSHSKPPLLDMMEKAAAEKGEGVDNADVNAAATPDLTPDGNADELLDATAESATAGPAEPDPITAPPEDGEPAADQSQDAPQEGEIIVTNELAADQTEEQATAELTSDGREMAPQPHKEKKSRHNH